MEFSCITATIAGFRIKIVAECEFEHFKTTTTIMTTALDIIDIWLLLMMGC